MDAVPVFTVFHEIQEVLALADVVSGVFQAVLEELSIILALFEILRVCFDVSDRISVQEVSNSCYSGVRTVATSPSALG